MKSKKDLEGGNPMTDKDASHEQGRAIKTLPTNIYQSNGINVRRPLSDERSKRKPGGC